MPPLEQVAVLLTLIRELEAMMRRENALLREMRLAPLAALQSDKVIMAEAYDIELRALRRAPERMASLPDEVRATLEQVTRDFQIVVRANVEAILAAKAATGRALRGMGESLAAVRPGRPAPTAAAAGHGRVVAFQRQM